MEELTFRDCTFTGCQGTGIPASLFQGICRISGFTVYFEIGLNIMCFDDDFSVFLWYLFWWGLLSLVTYGALL